MKKFYIIVALLIALPLAGILLQKNKEKNDKLESEIINAPELKGIGSIEIGMTYAEVKQALKQNRKQNKINYDLTKAVTFSKLYKCDISKLDLYKEFETEYYISSDLMDPFNSIFLILCFYQNKLIRIKVDIGAYIVEKAFLSKYGEGVGRELDMFWRSEDIEAHRFTSYMRITKDSEMQTDEFEVYIRDVDTFKEVAEYLRKAKEEKEKAILQELSKCL